MRNAPADTHGILPHGLSYHYESTLLLSFMAEVKSNRTPALAPSVTDGVTRFSRARLGLAVRTGRASRARGLAGLIPGFGWEPAKEKGQPVDSLDYLEFTLCSTTLKQGRF